MTNLSPSEAEQKCSHDIDWEAEHPTCKHCGASLTQIAINYRKPKAILIPPNSGELRKQIVACFHDELMETVADNEGDIELFDTKQVIDRLVVIFTRYSKAQALAVIGEDEVVPSYDGSESDNESYLSEWIRNQLRASQRQLLGQEGEE